MKKKMSKMKIVKLITLILTILILIGATIYMVPVMKQLGTDEGRLEFKDKINQAGPTGPLIVYGLEVAQVLLAVLPGEPIEILAGICFGPFWGTIHLMIAVTIITIIIYWAVRKFGRDFIYEFFSKEKVDKLENSKLFKDEKKIELVMILLFLVPGTPKDLLIYIGALLPIKPSRFLVISTLLRFPSIISSTIAGDSFLEGKWYIGIIAYVVTFLLTILIVLIVNKFDKTKTTRDILDTMSKKDSSD